MIENVTKTQSWVVGIILLPLVILCISPEYATKIFTALTVVPTWYQIALGGVFSAVLGVDIYNNIKGG